MSGDGAGTLFVIDERTGDIHATRRIDREEKAYYTLRAQAINRRTLQPVEPESEFVIKIHDINDNEPTFPEEVYIASVPEMSVVGKYTLQKWQKHELVDLTVNLGSWNIGWFTLRRLFKLSRTSRFFKGYFVWRSNYII